MKRFTVRPPKNLSCFARTAAVLLIVLFVISTMMSVFLINFVLVLLRPQTYKRTLDSRGLYEKLPDLIAEQLVHRLSMNPCAGDSSQCDGSSGSSTFPPVYMKNLDAAKWTHIFKLVLPAEWLKEQTDGVIDQFFAALKSPDQPKITILTGELRDSLSPEEVQDIVQTILASAPLCDPEELLRLTAIALGQSNESLPVCIPTEELRPFIEQALNVSLQTLIAQIPDQMEIKPSIFTQDNQNGAAGSSTPSGSNPHRVLSILRTVFLFSPLVPIFMLLLIALVAVRSWVALSRWWGIPLAASGLMLLTSATAALLLTSWLLKTVLIANLPQTIASGLVTMFSSVAQNVVNRFLFWIGLQAGLLFLAGCVLLVLSFFLKPRLPVERNKRESAPMTHKSGEPMG